MQTEPLHTLNEQFAIPSHLSFHAGPGGLNVAVINNAYAALTLSLSGAHVMSYRPHGGREVLWTSPSAAYELSDAMRGGIPVCWPWFADHPHDPRGMPIHGVVRTLPFAVTTASALEDGGTQVSLAAGDTPATRALWPHAFQIEVTITAGRCLRVAWAARNPGDSHYQYTGALHPYFSVSNVHDLTLRGLEGTEYLDKYDANRRKTQVGPVRFPTWIDNVYLNTTGDLEVEDPGFRRTIHIRKLGSRTSVVWNPAGDDASFPDVGAGQHPYFVCVESANAGNEIITVAPGSEERLGMEIECESWSNP
jgi:glucose-6-phosphate 1-epimerase